MNVSRPLILVLGSMLGVGLLAQSKESTTVINHEEPTSRSFVIVDHSDVRTMQGSWHDSAALFRYVHDHPGTYVVFQQAGGVYRLDSPERLAEVQRLYAPMKALSVQQDALAHAQGPLAKQQQNLGQQQRAATDPEDKGRIGTAQGAIGSEQGDLGAMQGALGHQQGEVARAAYKRMQTIFDQCLANGSCPRVAS